MPARISRVFHQESGECDGDAIGQTLSRHRAFGVDRHAARTRSKLAAKSIILKFGSTECLRAGLIERGQLLVALIDIGDDGGRLLCQLLWLISICSPVTK